LKTFNEVLYFYHLLYQIIHMIVNLYLYLLDNIYLYMFLIYHTKYYNNQYQYLNDNHILIDLHLQNLYIDILFKLNLFFLMIIDLNKNQVIQEYLFLNEFNNLSSANILNYDKINLALYDLFFYYHFLINNL
jgi:hypothetical protein